jgi:hypothetical protein
MHGEKHKVVKAGKSSKKDAGGVNCPMKSCPKPKSMPMGKMMGKGY